MVKTKALTDRTGEREGETKSDKVHFQSNAFIIQSLFAGIVIISY